MRCPNCDGEFLLGQDVCDVCGTDLTYLSVPGPKKGRLHKIILKDPLSQLNLPQPVTLRETDTVAEAVREMRENSYGSVLVLDEEGKEHVTTIRLQQWQGAPDAGKWVDKAELRKPAPVKQLARVAA